MKVICTGLKNGSVAKACSAVALVATIFLLSAPVANAQQMSQSARVVLKACKPDMARLCSAVPVGGGRVKACMKEHIHELSEPCKEAMFQAWLKH